MRADIAALKERIAKLEARAKPSVALGPPHTILGVSRAVACSIGALLDMPPEHVTEQQRLRDIGLDDLGKIELALTLEERLGLAGELDSTWWVTVGDVVRMVARVPTVPPA